MLKIGLTFTGEEEKHQNYHRWLQGTEEDIEIVRLSETLANEKDFAGCDALVLSGGIDIHPNFYGGKQNYPGKPVKGWNLQRDKFEFTLLQSALDRKLPVLGICRGLQLINIAMMGTLVQDLGYARNSQHKKEAKDAYDNQHAVEIKEGSVLYKIAGQLSGMVNSAHHQAIDKLGEKLRVNCTAPDGVIEGIEWFDPNRRPFLLGIQWHAERMYIFNLQKSPLSANVRGEFINEIRKLKL